MMNENVFDTLMSQVIPTIFVIIIIVGVVGNVMVVAIISRTNFFPASCSPHRKPKNVQKATRSEGNHHRNEKYYQSKAAQVQISQGTTSNNENMAANNNFLEPLTTTTTPGIDSDGASKKRTPRAKMSPTTLLILNLAITDILFLLICVSMTAATYAFARWPSGNVSCKIVQYLIYVTAYGSIYTLVLMSLDRYLAVVHPFTLSPRYRNNHNAILAIAIMWILVLGLNGPVLKLYRARTNRIINWQFATDFNGSTTTGLMGGNSGLNFMQDEGILIDDQDMKNEKVKKIYEAVKATRYKLNFSKQPIGKYAKSDGDLIKVLKDPVRSNPKIPIKNRLFDYDIPHFRESKLLSRILKTAILMNQSFDNSFALISEGSRSIYLGTYQEVTICLINNYNGEKNLFISFFWLGFAIPLILITILYISLLRVLWTKPISGSTAVNAQQNKITVQPLTLNLRTLSLPVMGGTTKNNNLFSPKTPNAVDQILDHGVLFCQFAAIPIAKKMESDRQRQVLGQHFRFGSSIPTPSIKVTAAASSLNFMNRWSSIFCTMNKKHHKSSENERYKHPSTASANVTKLHKRSSNRRKVTKMVTVIVLAFAVCWFPIHIVFYIIHILGHHEKQVLAFQAFAQCLAYMNSCINPILYSLLSDNFKEGFKYLMGQFVNICPPCLNLSFYRRIRHNSRFRSLQNQRKKLKPTTKYGLIPMAQTCSSFLSLSDKSKNLESNLNNTTKYERKNIIPDIFVDESSTDYNE